MSTRTLLPIVLAFALMASACSSDGTTEEGASADSTSDSVSETTSGGEDAVGSESQPDEQDPSETVPLGEQIGAVEITGDYLDQMPQQIPVTEAENDPAIGQLAPEIVGTSFDGSTVTISADGTPRMVMFVAHWCSHCQREVPAVKAMIDDGLLPENLEVVVVSTAVREDENNYSPQEWLQREKWSGPIMRDSAGFDALLAFGAGGFPFAVYLNADHEVVTRTAGEIPSDIIQQLWLATAAA